MKRTAIAFGILFFSFSLLHFFCVSSQANAGEIIICNDTDKPIYVTWTGVGDKAFFYSKVLQPEQEMRNLIDFEEGKSIRISLSNLEDNPFYYVHVVKHKSIQLNLKASDLMMPENVMKSDSISPREDQCVVVPKNIGSDLRAPYPLKSGLTKEEFLRIASDCEEAEELIQSMSRLANQENLPVGREASVEQKGSAISSLDPSWRTPDLESSNSRASRTESTDDLFATDSPVNIQTLRSLHEDVHIVFNTLNQMIDYLESGEGILVVEKKWYEGLKNEKRSSSSKRSKKSSTNKLSDIQCSSFPTYKSIQNYRNLFKQVDHAVCCAYGLIYKGSVCLSESGRSSLYTEYPIPDGTEGNYINTLKRIRRHCVDMMTTKAFNFRKKINEIVDEHEDRGSSLDVDVRVATAFLEMARSALQTISDSCLQEEYWIDQDF